MSPGRISVERRDGIRCCEDQRLVPQFEAIGRFPIALGPRSACIDISAFKIHQVPARDFLYTRDTTMLRLSRLVHVLFLPTRHSSTLLTKDELVSEACAG